MLRNNFYKLPFLLSRSMPMCTTSSTLSLSLPTSPPKCPSFNQCPPLVLSFLFLPNSPFKQRGNLSGMWGRKRDLMLTSQNPL